MLRTKLFLAFAALALLLGGLSAALGVRALHRHAVEQAQNRAALDLGGAWMALQTRLREIELAAEFLAGDTALAAAAAEGRWDDPAARARLAAGLAATGLDFLTLADADGLARIRPLTPGADGDDVSGGPVWTRARDGRAAAGVEIWTADRLAREAPELAARARIALRPTEAAAAAAAPAVEDRGLVLLAAAPVLRDGVLHGVLQGGLLLNRNHALVDQIADLVYRGEEYEGHALGTATVFLDDRRIATTVRDRDGGRALGTCASREVAAQVLERREPWVGRAFVVRDWHLTAYDPILDPDGRVLGMLYVGLLEQPYLDLARRAAVRHGLLVLLGIAAALGLAFPVAGRIAQPIHRLAEAARTLADGHPHAAVAGARACEELDMLIHDFNRMADALGEREAGLREVQRRLEETNTRLRGLNASYMDMLGFVSHELKSPVAALHNYLWTLERGKLGPLNERQTKVLRVMDGIQKRMAEMVRHYLGLSRIESGEFKPAPARLRLRADAIHPVVESLHDDLEGRGMRLELDVDEAMEIDADPAQVREVFDNLIGNAVKYGRDGALIRVTAQFADGAVRATVWNEGEGIPADRLAEVFGKFKRLEPTAPGRQRRGTGLGLFITRHIVEAHGGTIDVASEPGHWVEFRMVIPQPPQLDGTPTAV
jgi:two-component system, NtrC family, sensor kinase